MINEPLLQESLDRFVLLPIKYDNLWKMYKEQMANFWTAEEINLSDDLSDWAKLNKDEKHFISHILAFFSASDGIVNENLCLRFYNDIKAPEARAFYTFQMAMETIHAETYAQLIDTYIKNPKEKEYLFKAVENIPCIQKKADWAMKWIHSQDDFALRLLAFAAVEGIFFSGSFCSIFWLKKRGLMPGLAFSNELISRDEGLHTKFAIELYKMLNNKPSVEVIKNLITEAVAFEKEFITEALPVSLIGMNAKLMSQYIEYVADHLMLQIGHKPIYGATNPFDWMELISLEGKTNYFEKQNSSYKKAGIVDSKTDEKFSLTMDF